jgi:uncharacterized protein with WD repeat
VIQQPAGVRPHFGLLGIGRGAGRGLSKTEQPQFIVPNVNKATNEDDVDQSKKQIRKCEKKIREIEGLEVRYSQGETLNDAEMTKINSKKALLVQLRELRLMID